MSRVAHATDLWRVRNSSAHSDLANLRTKFCLIFAHRFGRGANSVHVPTRTQAIYTHHVLGWGSVVVPVMFFKPCTNRHCTDHVLGWGWGGVLITFMSVHVHLQTQDFALIRVGGVPAQAPHADSVGWSGVLMFICTHTHTSAAH